MIDGADISIPFITLSGSFHCPQTNSYLKKLCQVQQCGSANLWQTWPPSVTAMILLSITNTSKGPGNKWLRLNRFPFQSYLQPSLWFFRMNDDLSHGIPAAPITTALVASIRRSTLWWLHGFESRTRHFPQHLIREKMIAEEPCWVFKISSVLSLRLPWRWHEITVYNYQHSRHSQMSLGFLLAPAVCH